MSSARFKRAALGALCGLVVALGVGAPTAQAAFDDPLFIFRPKPPPPPAGPEFPLFGFFEGPCGLAVNGAGNFYVSDYYHHNVDVFTPGTSYIAQIAGEDPLDGPCGLALDAADNLYVNNFHRNVVRFDPQPSFGPGTTIAGIGLLPEPPEPSHPTGVAVDKASGDVYVDERTHVAVFDSTGAELEQIGSFDDGYGVAVSEYGPTLGLVYVPDAATDTVEVYHPSTSTTDPVAAIVGAGVPAGHFTSLRNSAVAVDRVTGEIYVVDDLTPEYISHHEGVVYVFTAAGAYEGRLKFSVDNALPAGLAVDNSTTATQGRVYVTSGNSEFGAVYAYPPQAATSAAVPLPKPPPAGGSGGGGSGSDLAAAAASLTPAAAPSSPAPTAEANTLTVAKSQRAHKRHKAAKHRHRAKHRRHARKHRHR
jgi:hypothetical protein